ncbi:hypothetical protein RN001_015108 [Aquatica leii]|uniref:Uncharacterized protein n=1 Tax=Aquatica leii TaxID=1421715 RepID=A0AAN7PP84_9COLE|nr:hypothetical protein RN001_015108 [Aquatica leii]
MFTYNRIIIYGVIVIMCSYNALGFFWGSSEQTSPRPLQPYPIAGYYQRVIQVPQQAQPVNDDEPVPVPAIPIQMPLQASLSPMPNIQNVQLVPCVCPIQSDFEYDKPIETNNVYVTPKYPTQ